MKADDAIFSSDFVLVLRRQMLTPAGNEKAIPLSYLLHNVKCSYIIFLDDTPAVSWDSGTETVTQG